MINLPFKSIISLLFVTIVLFATSLAAIHAAKTSLSSNVIVKI